MQLILVTQDMTIVHKNIKLFYGIRIRELIELHTMK